LFGQKSDWEFILRRIEKLQIPGKEPKEWSKLLVPIITRFVSAFNDPDSKGNTYFWPKFRIITVEEVDLLTSLAGSQPFGFLGEGGITLNQKARKDSHYLDLDGALFHHIDMHYILPDFASVPVKIDDNGHEYIAKMLAGSVGMRCSKSQALEQSGEEGEDTPQPEVEWWMFRVMDDDRSDNEIIRPDSSRVRERKR
jgi:hypothetical protein